jgi:phosphoglucosamine mutase
MYIIALARQSVNQDVSDVVGTLMTNLGVEHAFNEQGISLHRAKVGDRYVMETLKKVNGEIGGEASGHIICLDKTSTGDGIIAALQVLAEVVRAGESLNSLRSGVKKYPQTLINVRVEKMFDVANHPVVLNAVAEAEAKLADQGRVLLRASGTEPVIRVMVEGQDADLTQQLATSLANMIEELK